jgi:hypothetical protein
MRAHAVIAFGALLFASVPASVTAQSKQKAVLLSHLVSPTVSIRLFAAVGDIRVIGWDRDSLEMSGSVPVGSHVEMNAGSSVEAAKGMKMFIEAPTEQSGREGRIVLRVPRGARVWLKTGSADMDVAGITGGLDLNVVGGSITVHGSPREVRAESMDGNVIIDGTPEWLRAKTATGDITFHGGQDVGASTISGTIRTSGGTVERAKLEATTGAISFATELARGANVELETHSGTIDVALPPKAAAELDVATITGVIENQWTKARPVVGKEGRGATLTTSMGMSGGRVIVRSFKGTVRLRTFIGKA